MIVICKALEDEIFLTSNDWNFVGKVTCSIPYSVWSCKFLTISGLTLRVIATLDGHDMVAIGCKNGVWTTSRHDPWCIWFFHPLYLSSHSQHLLSNKTSTPFRGGDSMCCAGWLWYLPCACKQCTGPRSLAVGLPLMNALDTPWLPHRRAFDTITIWSSKHLLDTQKNSWIYSCILGPWTGHWENTEHGCSTLTTPVEARVVIPRVEVVPCILHL